MVLLLTHLSFLWTVPLTIAFHSAFAVGLPLSVGLALSSTVGSTICQFVSRNAVCWLNLVYRLPLASHQWTNNIEFEIELFPHIDKHTKSMAKDLQQIRRLMTKTLKH
jgi:hypothetical protein